MAGTIMPDGRPWDLVIIGAGMAGLSTAIWARRLGLSALVLEQEPAPGGQLTAIRGRIIDYPGLDVPEGAALTERLLRQARDLGAEIRLDTPVRTLNGHTLACGLQGGEVVAGRAVVIATGITAKQLGVPGEPELYQRHLVRRPSHDLAWFTGKTVAVIGGGDRAAENAFMLKETAAHLYLLHRGSRLRARASLADPIRRHPQITVMLSTRVQAFAVADDRLTVLGEQDGQPLHLSADAVCIYIGNRPNSHLVAGQVDLTEDGYIVTDRHGQTSLPGVYAAGDVCTLPSFQALVSAAGQAMVVAKRIALEQGR